MSNREVVLWLDERWYDALERHIKGETLQEKMQRHLDELCSYLLPDYEYEQIRKEICRERQEWENKYEANRRFAVFHVTERGEQSRFLVEGAVEFLDAARLVRRYTRGQSSASDLHNCFSRHYLSARDVNAAEFEQYVSERLENTGRVTGAFDIDLDAGTFGALHIDNGWGYFFVKDVCTAAFHADRCRDESPDERWEHFLNHLDGKELTPQTPAQDAPGMGMEPTMC